MERSGTVMFRDFLFSRVLDCEPGYIAQIEQLQCDVFRNRTENKTTVTINVEVIKKSGVLVNI